MDWRSNVTILVKLGSVIKRRKGIMEVIRAPLTEELIYFHLIPPQRVRRSLISLNKQSEYRHLI